MCEGIRDDGSEIEPNDPFWDDLTATAKRSREDPRAWLAMRHIYGDLGDDTRFAGAFEKWLGKIRADGMDAALDAYLEG